MGDVSGWVQTQLNDSSFIRRSVALDRLQKAQPPLRRAAALQFGTALSNTSSAVRSRAVSGIRALGSEAIQVLGELEKIAADTRDPLRAQAISAIGSLGASARGALPVIREAEAQANVQTRFQAAQALVQLGDTSGATAALLRLTSNPLGHPFVLAAARVLASLGHAEAVPVLQSFLSDSSFSVRTSAAAGLGILGPKARAAIPSLAMMLGDTVPRRVAQGQASETESGAAFAAWALARIIPFRSVASNTVIDPVYVSVASAPFSLRGDDLGLYAWGVDSVSAFVGSGLFLHLSPPSPGRGPMGPIREGFRRSLAFDLSDPVTGSGATPQGIISDNEAYVWIWYRRDSTTDRVTTVREIAVSDSVHNVERIEMHFRIDEVLHVLQMGPFVEGQGGAGVWFTGMHGEGTSLARLVHPTPEVWIVSASPGSLARLWSFEDRTRPIDRGLYHFSLSLRFTALPTGAMGGCVPTLTCSWINRD